MNSFIEFCLTRPYPACYNETQSTFFVKKRIAQRIRGVMANMSDRIYKVVVHFDAEYGQIEYDTHEKTIRVLINDQDKRQSVEKYLSEPHVMDSADGSDLRTFHSKNVKALEDLASMKLALTRLWQHTGVYVDWSRPTS
jgi:hypothetical protein